MKTSHKKKKKKKGSRKEERSRKKETEIMSISDPTLTIDDGDKKSKSRQVISRGVQDKRTNKKNIITEYAGIAFQFLKDSRAELKKVKWPTRKELLASTAMVIFLTIAIALFLGLIDFGLMNIIQAIVE